MRTPWARDSGGDVQVTLLIDGHPVSTTPGSEIVNDALLAQRAFRRQIECPDLAIAPLNRATIDEVQCLLIRRERDAVGTLDVGLADDANLVRLISVTSTSPDGNTVVLSAYHTNY